MGEDNLILIGFDWDIIQLIESISRYKITGYVDRQPASYNEFPYLGTDQEFLHNNKDTTLQHTLAISIDDPQVRKKLHLIYKNHTRPTLLSPDARVSKRAEIGESTLIQQGVAIMPKSIIGKGCLLNLNASVHHETRIGEYTTLAPGAQLLGRVTVGNGCYIGAGAIIKQDCTVGDNSVVGAGAVVINDVHAGTTVVGVPATRNLAQKKPQNQNRSQ